MKEYIKNYLNEAMNVSITSIPRTEKFKLKKNNCYPTSFLYCSSVIIPFGSYLFVLCQERTEASVVIPNMPSTGSDYFF
jgi:hypothetical protein